MHRTSQAVVDALSSPVVVTTATAVGGMVVWKSLEVHKENLRLKLLININFCLINCAQFKNRI